MSEVWTKWESLVINGVFPLRRFLSKSNHSVVFLTEHKAQNLADAAIKLIPADPVLAEAQLSRWRTAAALSHPHLIRLLDVGRCQLGGHKFLFVVMEYADQTLAQILQHRALTPDEVGEMLPATLDALAFLHRQRLVQGQLKPPNVLVVGDTVKLASDTIRPAGVSRASAARPGLYDPPEAKDGKIYAAGDIWALGITLAEALTQSPPEWPDEGCDTTLSAMFPPAFADTVLRCLRRNPANRPTVTDLEAHYKPVSDSPVGAVPMAEPVAVASDEPVRPTSIPIPIWSNTPFVVPAIALGLLILVLMLVWGGLRLFQSHSSAPQPAASASYTRQAASSAAAPMEAAPAPVGAIQTPKTAVPVTPAVLHQEMPEVSRGARESIRGHILITIRVTVDRSGNAIHESVENPGSSKYFSRLALAAASKWKFTPTDAQEPRAWLLWFEFSRSGTTARAALARS